MSPLGIVGDGIEGYGCPPMDPLAAGLIHMEINRGDGSLGTFMAVQAGLAMKAIAKCGSEEQKERWLGPMARLEKIGAFALTEPEHGSDSVRWRPRRAATGIPTSSAGTRSGSATAASPTSCLGAGHLGPRGEGVPGRERQGGQAPRRRLSGVTAQRRRRAISRLATAATRYTNATTMISVSAAPHTRRNPACCGLLSSE